MFRYTVELVKRHNVEGELQIQGIIVGGFMRKVTRFTLFSACSLEVIIKALECFIRNLVFLSFFFDIHSAEQKAKTQFHYTNPQQTTQ